jgi:Cysteine rich repeat
MRQPSRWRAGGLIATVMILSALASMSEGRAQQNGGDIPPQARKACMADYRKLCPGVRPGEGRVVACFEQHLRQVSPGCRQAMGERIEEKRSH